TGATGYAIQRAEGAAGTFATVASNVAATSYDDTGLEPETEYRYQVRALSGTRTSDFTAAVTIRTGTEGPKVAVVSSDITADRTLHADTVYTLRGFVKVGNGATLT